MKLGSIQTEKNVSKTSHPILDEEVSVDFYKLIHRNGGLNLRIDELLSQL